MAKTTKKAPDKPLVPVYAVDLKVDFVPIQEAFASITTRLNSGVYDPDRIQWLQEQMKVEEDPCLRAARAAARPALKLGHTEETCEIFSVTRDPWDFEIIKRFATTDEGKLPFIRALAKIGRFQEAKVIADGVAWAKRPYAVLFEATRWASDYAHHAVGEVDLLTSPREQTIALAHIIPHLESYYQGKSQHFMNRMKEAIATALEGGRSEKTDDMLLQVVKSFIQAKRFDVAHHWVGVIGDRVTRAQGLIAIAAETLNDSDVRQLIQLVDDIVVRPGMQRVDCEAKLVQVRFAIRQGGYKQAVELAHRLSYGPYGVEAWCACFRDSKTGTAHDKIIELVQELRVDVDLGMTQLVIDRARLAYIEALIAVADGRPSLDFELKTTKCANRIQDVNIRSTAFLKKYCEKLHNAELMAIAAKKRSLGP